MPDPHVIAAAFLFWLAANIYIVRLCAAAGRERPKPPEVTR